MSTAGSILGPRVPQDELQAHRSRYRWPTACFFIGMLALIASMWFPYWNLDLKAPQFPRGLHVSVYINRVVGHTDPLTGSNDLTQLDGLNHYVGMPKLEEGASLERSIALIAIVVFAGLLLAALYVHSKWVTLLALPALLFPLLFLADLQYWLWKYGHSLDPEAPLAGAVGEFTPHLFGPSKIAQFDTMATPGFGLFLAVLASVAVGIGLWLHRKAYKPLIEAGRRAEQPSDGTAAADDTAIAATSQVAGS